MEANISVESQDIEQEVRAQTCAFVLSDITRNEAYLTPEARNMEAMAETFVSKKELEEERFPMNPVLIAREQRKDTALKDQWQSTVLSIELKR
jgi:hypothetical protein